MNNITHQDFFSVATHGQGTTNITSQVAQVVAASGVNTGLAHVFVQHTSCSLVIMENADPSARHDLETFMERLVPENEPYYTHTAEGPDDSPSHIRMALTRTSETLPVHNGRLAMGMWQGIYLWEHRAAPHSRRLVVTVQGAP
ncbi:MAG: secondary thiamine-phosphate synthase enzyme YjbQ [Algisphaera sp.]